MRDIANSDLVKNTANEIFNLLQPYVCAIYLGGSQVDDYIKNAHDIDYFIYVNYDEDVETVRQILKDYLKVPAGVTWLGRYNNDLGVYEGFPGQGIRPKGCGYMGYISPLQIYLIGDPTAHPLLDIINNLEHRQAYLTVLKQYTLDLSEVDPTSYKYKRWYRVYRGLHIYKNNSYELTSEQADELNMLHDMKEEDSEKISKLIEWLKIEVENL